MPKRRMVLDTGVILPFSFYRMPSSRKKVIELLLDNFDIYLPDKVAQEMGRRKRRLEAYWDEIALTWDRLKDRFNKKNPPNACLNHVLAKSKKKDLTFIPAEYDVLALGLCLSRCQKDFILLATHEKDAFRLFNFLSRKEQIGYIFSPFDLLLFVHVYLGVTFEDADYVWRELIDFPNMNVQFNFRPIEYSNSLEDCFRRCSTPNCTS